MASFTFCIPIRFYNQLTAGNIPPEEVTNQLPTWRMEFAFYNDTQEVHVGVSRHPTIRCRCSAPNNHVLSAFRLSTPRWQTATQSEGDSHIFYTNSLVAAVHRVVNAVWCQNDGREILTRAVIFAHDPGFRAMMTLPIRLRIHHDPDLVPSPFDGSILMWPPQSPRGIPLARLPPYARAIVMPEWDRAQPQFNEDLRNITEGLLPNTDAPSAFQFRVWE